MVRYASPKPAPSSTILLVDTASDWAGEDGVSDRRYRYWLHYAEGSLMPPLLLKLVVSRLGLFGWAARRYVDGQMHLHLDYLEKELDHGPGLLETRSPPRTHDELSAGSRELARGIEHVATEPHGVPPAFRRGRLIKGR